LIITELVQPDTRASVPEAYSSIIAIDPDAHDWGAWTALDGAQHQRVCKNDPSHVEKEAHKWTDGSDACEVCGLAYPKPSVNNSKGGSFASTSDEITYTVTQEVPGWATSVRLWTDLEPVLLYTVDEDDVTVTTSDGSTLTGVSVSIDGQRLAVEVDDASGLRGQDIQFSYKAHMRDDADLAPYLNDAKDTAAVPYRASVSFDGADKEVSSDTKHVKFKVSVSRSGSSKADSDQGGIAKTGDSLLYVCAGIVAVAATAAAVSAFANRRRKRD
jgi:fimbrial isopeptide formation D2 family protein